MNTKVKRALLSVTDKSGLEEFARGLSKRGVEIIASGGTAAAVSKAGIDVIEISDLTGFPECMDGRVKTLHPKIHGGILADREKDTHLEQAEKLEIGLIDLVAVNLYKFREAAADPELDEKGKIEQIDIGGPTLIRSAAKNYHSVAIVVDPEDYSMILDELDAENGETTLDTRRTLSSKAFHHTASYDAAISGFFDSIEHPDGLPEEKISVYKRSRSLRYGENPHQEAALYISASPEGCFTDFVQHQGKELCFNNIQDMWAAFLMWKDLRPGSCAILKHMNPSGVAKGADPLDNFIRARNTDPLSAFGSIICVNDVVDGEFAEATKTGFVEVVLARGFTEGALDTLKKKKIFV